MRNSSCLLLPGQRSQIERSLSLIGATGTPTTLSNLRGAFRRLCERAGLGQDWTTYEPVGISTPDAGEEGLDPLVMLHAVLGTPETLDDYEKYLHTRPDPRHRMRVYPDGTQENVRRLAEDASATR